MSAHAGYGGYAGPGALDLRDDESLYSLVGRQFFQSGRPSQCAFLSAITGGHRRALSLTLPCNLARALQVLPLTTALTLDDAIDRFTLVPLVRPFLSARDWGAIRRLVAAPAPQAARMRLGVVRIGRGWPGGLRHCGECARAQLKAHGSPYWTLRFSLPFVTACPEHGGWLVPCQPVGRFPITATSPVGVPPLSLLEHVSEGAISAHQRLSSLACELHAARLPPVGQLRLVSVYRACLAQQGLLSCRGRIDLRGVRERLYCDWGELPQAREMLDGAASFLNRLFTSRASPVRAPLPHLLTVGTLFGSVAAWNQQLSELSECAGALHVAPARQQYAGTREVALGAWHRGPPRGSSAGRPPGGVVALLERGWPVKRVASRLKVNLKTVYRVLHADDELFVRWGAAGLQKEVDRRSIPAALPSRSGSEAQKRRIRNDLTWQQRHRVAMKAARFVAQGPAQSKRGTVPAGPAGYV